MWFCALSQKGYCEFLGEGRLDYQPLFGKGAQAPPPKASGRNDTRERRKSSLRGRGSLSLISSRFGTAVWARNEGSQNGWKSSLGGVSKAKLLKGESEKKLNFCRDGAGEWMSNLHITVFFYSELSSDISQTHIL